MDSSRLERIVGKLRANGERVTDARVAVLHALLDSDEHEHRTAADIVGAAQRIDPQLHRATVYRTLGLFDEIGVVEHVHVEHGAVVFHLTDERHQHLVCEACGLVLEAPIDVVNDLAKELERTYRFHLHAGHSPLTGLCHDCERKHTHVHQ